MSVIEVAPAPQSPVVTDETRDILRTAKGILAQGWTQCPPGYNDDALCLVQALFKAGEKWNDRGCVNALGFASLGWAIAWNDAPGRTQDEVVALIDRALGA